MKTGKHIYHRVHRGHGGKTVVSECTRIRREHSLTMYYLHVLQVLHGKKDFFVSWRLCARNGPATAGCLCG